MYLFPNLDLGGITKLPTEAELRCTSGDMDSSNENRTSYNSLPISNSSDQQAKTQLPIPHSSYQDFSHHTGLSVLVLTWVY